MIVLFVISVCGIRSTGRIVTDLADDFIEKGHECMVAYGRESVPEKYRSVSYRIGTQTDVKINALKARILDKLKMQDGLSANGLFRLFCH